MKTSAATGFAAAMAAVVIIAAAAAASPAQLAPVYPGAMPDPAASVEHARVYLSKAPLPEVRHWYAKRLAKQSIAACASANADKGCGSFQQDCDSDAGPKGLSRCTDLLVIKWNAIPPGGGMVDAYHAGVHLEGWQKSRVAPDAGASAARPATDPMAKAMAGLSARMQAADRGETQQAGSETGLDLAGLAAIPDVPFQGFKQEVIAGRHTQKELEAVYRRYSYLTTSVYPTVKGQYGPIAYDKLVFAQCKEKYLTRRTYLTGAAGHGHWKDWLRCLSKLAERAYRTRIVIDVN